MSAWTYSGNDSDRIARLRERFAFGDLVTQLVAGSRVLFSSIVRSRNGPGEFYRVEYGLYVGHEFFDRLFNSYDGYRGAYYRSPAEGVQANLELTHGLADLLTSSNKMVSPCPMPENSESWLDKWHRRSLLANSARVWLCEKGKAYGEWGIESPRQEGSRLVRIENEKWEPRDQLCFEDGTIAPFLENIHIIGAFIDLDGNEWTPERKVLRAEQLHFTGWT